MHARPAVKLTKLAKKFQAHISIRASDAAEWINAKSVAKVMALRAARDSIIEIKAFGEDAEAAVAALVDLVAADFPESSHVNMQHGAAGLPTGAEPPRSALRAGRSCAVGCGTERQACRGTPEEERARASRRLRQRSSRQIADGRRRCGR